MTGIDLSKTYFTGKPCKRGHVAPRQLSNKTCTECVRVAYHANAIKRRVRMKAYREANPLIIKAASKRWKDANPEACRRLHRLRRVRKRAATGSHTVADVLRIYAAQRGMCANCRVHLHDKYHVDHILALANGGSDDPHNLQCLCKLCNQRKHAKLPHEWAKTNGRLL